jgi:hypothetical protein
VREISVPANETLIGGPRYGYADSFEVQLSEGDVRSPEQFVQALSS